MVDEQPLHKQKRQDRKQDRRKRVEHRVVELVFEVDRVELHAHQAVSQEVPEVLRHFSQVGAVDDLHQDVHDLEDLSSPENVSVRADREREVPHDLEDEQADECNHEHRRTAVLLFVALKRASDDP
eukprot:CAMPEP_0168331004 /NCGR_PEP_ID=MMETSP0213-20121227/8075_1 /TAXON_ID=151035 /ORGANISM="Euplotes harpa, Strain FSP1.4" /LENGTH=125 /DNA_ID=CAMNT_0008334697 /DNA_START=436 /DNA_END=813 /DNA_ORIENTATION=-